VVVGSKKRRRRFRVEWDASASTPEGSMTESDSRPDERIERLEGRVEELREAIRRSRILAAAGRACALAGAAWLAGLMFGFATFMPVRFVSGVVVRLGGLILMGSSVGSTRQLELSLRQAENERTRRLTPWNWSPSKMANDFSARSRRTRRRTATGNTSWESVERHSKRSTTFPSIRTARSPNVTDP